MSKLFHKDKPIAGIDISTTGVKMMAIHPKRMTVIGYGSVDLDPNKVQGSLSKSDDYIALGIKKLVHEKLVGHLPSNQVVVSVPTNRTYSRTMNLPMDAEGNLDEAVQLEADQYIPIATSELNIDYEIIDRTKKNLTVLISAVPKKVVESVVSSCEKAGFEPVLVEPGINAAARLVGATEEGHLPSIIVDVGAATSDIALLDQGIIRVTGGAAVGGHTFTFRISEKLKVSLEEAHQLKVHSGLNVGPHQAKLQSALSPLLDQIATETRKIIRYYNERLESKTKVEQIIIVGGGSNLPGLGEFMTEAMLMPARVGNPWHALSFGKLQPPTKQFKPRYVNAAGLALVDPKEVWSS
ncbi:MAG: type IV pilus assembly protein PilM [Candidatus Saccharimonadales bacterium]